MKTDQMEGKKKNGIMRGAVIGILAVAAILILGTIWTGRSANNATNEAVRSVSLLYLNELADRREQVVASNLHENINNMVVAIGLMDQNDLSDMEHLQAFQARMKELYRLEKFAFVDSNGLIYTSQGTQNNIDQYSFDYKTISGAEISIKDLESKKKKVIIAVPVDNISFMDHELVACFMEIDMERMLEGVSMKAGDNDVTFCNIYTRDGYALSNMILGGMASETNLFTALEHANFEDENTTEKVKSDFTEKKEGVASFTYRGIQETLYYVPVEGTDWMLTYLVRESLISNQIQSISHGIITRSLFQTILTGLVLVIMFVVIIRQIRQNSKLALDKEVSEAAGRIKQEALENQLVLQERLLEQEKQRTQQDNMITALSKDYRSVYYIGLDSEEGICYRTDSRNGMSFEEGEHFSFREVFETYADRYVAESYREGFKYLIDTGHIRKGLEGDQIITYRYLVVRDGHEAYEMIRIAGIRQQEDGATDDDSDVHAAVIGFSDVDRETRDSLAKSQALSDALTAAKEANNAKTAFLSNMSHEIRTPMNAIIGLDNIALSDPEISDSTREHLEKIGGSAQHLLMLINDILDMSRIESGKMTLKNEEFSMSRMIEQINTLISGQCIEKKLDYDCQIRGQIEEYYIGDDTKLRQVLINILGNAVKFTPEGGKVEFVVEPVNRFDRKSTLRFIISDTGIGMSKEFLPKIFDTFAQEDSSTTSKYGSSGLGLSITKNIVELMNGDIAVESEKGVGSTFTVTVTLMDAEHQYVEGEETEITPRDMCVLIIDDDPMACEHARLVLEKVGIASESALSGEEALEMVRLRHARREPYNLILVDWKMPEMDGVETTRQIRSIVGHESAIIILTAYKWDDVVEEAQEAGVDSFLAKPLFASSILEEFQSALKRKNISIAQEKKKVDLTGRRVLLAEDMQINAEIIMMVLKIRQMEVDHVLNGKLAVEQFSSSAEGYYDAILMDIRMPEMDGLQATAEIRKMDRADAKSVPIIALTANAFDEDVQRSLQAGMNAHLSKPVEKDILFETLESLIRE